MTGSLTLLDWLCILFYLLLTLAVSWILRKRARGGAADYFLGGRKLTWYLAGVSMVATTFAADTPLAVTELVGTRGISGNWLWWNMLAGGMLTVFFFARFWRRAGILTEPEFAELRYAGAPAAFLRGFKAVYLGLFMNALIIGWVNVALMTILEVFFHLSRHHSLLVTAALMLFSSGYSALSGLWGVIYTDFIQFFIAMAGCIVLAVVLVNSGEVGGIAGLVEKLPPGALSCFPTLQGGAATGGAMAALGIGAGAFFAYIGVQWWASWYPGAEPGGGGYIAQRMMSTKNERHALWATLLFQVAHYCIRPWPWIIAALACMVLYPDLPPEQKRLAYVMAMRDYLPAGLKGLLLVAFLAAYMSTISTQLNWGSSYLTNDLYLRFLTKGNAGKREGLSPVAAGRLFTWFIMLAGLAVTPLITTIAGVWEFMLECGAGLGLVLILRWYWWRINAWSEITATAMPFAVYALARSYGMEFPGSYFLTVGVTTAAWLAVTALTPPESRATLTSFYRTIRPGGWWKPIARQFAGEQKGAGLSKPFTCWLCAIAMTYSLLFATGDLIFRRASAGFWLMTGGLSLVALILLMRKENSK